VAGGKNLVDIELARPEAVIPAFRKNVASVAQRFDTVVIDTPPALGLRMSAALIAATAVVCPIELEEYSIDGVTDMLKTIFGVRQRYNRRLQLAGIVLNRFNPHSVRQKAAMQQLVDHYREFVIPARISTRSAIPEALAGGLPVWELPTSSAREGRRADCGFDRDDAQRGVVVARLDRGKISMGANVVTGKTRGNSIHYRFFPDLLRVAHWYFSQVHL